LGTGRNRSRRDPWRVSLDVLGFPVLPDPAASELEALVARTAGPQPWRKAFHAVNAVLIASALALFDWPHRPLIFTLAGAVVALLALDLLRLANPRANELFFRAFGKLASPREARGVASSTWYAFGILVAVALFPRPEAIAGVLVLGLADPAAALVGRTLGRRPFLGGTLEGSVAFFATSATVLAFQYPWPAVIAAALAGSVVERRSWPLDDNLTVPVVCAAVLVWLGSP
jgi:dolichol kinase